MPLPAPSYYAGAAAGPTGRTMAQRENKQDRGRPTPDTPEIPSTYSASSPEAAANSRYHGELIDDLRGRLGTVYKGGSEKAVELHRKRKKLTVRERISRLLGPGEPWLEFSPMAAAGMYGDEVPGAGIVTGAARIGGRWCVIVANDATVKGGTYYPETIKKHLRAQEIALENRLPTIYLADSGGIFLPKQAEVFADKGDFGRIFYNQAVMSSLDIPQVSAVMGMCTAGGAYLPAMSDENVIVRGTGTVYLGGPPLVKAATGEDSTEEELGGGEMHSHISGVMDHLAKSDEHAIHIVRSIVENLNTPKSETSAGFDEPLYPAEELYGIVNRDLRRPADIKQVIARLVDGSRFHEFKAGYGKTLVCGFASWTGRPVGIIGNQGILFSESAQKGAHFIELCGQRGIPLVFLQNITGFMVGKKFEQGGIIKHGAKLVQAVSTVPVPKITVIVGASNGAGNYAMCGRAYGARFLFAWPNSRVSVMGAAQAAGVMVTIKQAKLGRPLTAEEEAEIKKPILEQYERESHPYYATSRLWDDGIIEPADTRKVVGWALEMAALSPQPMIGAGRTPVYRM